MRISIIVAVACATLAAPTAAPAQALVGHVRDSSGAPLRDVSVSLLDRMRRLTVLVRTNHEGRFELRAPEAGFYAIAARKLGYTPRTTDWLELEAGETFAIEFVLGRVPAALTAVVVKAQRDSILRTPVLGLNLRASSATIVTPTQVEMRAPVSRDFLDLVRDLAPPWAQVWGEAPDGCVATPSSNPPNSCLMVLVDGVRLHPPSEINQHVIPDWVDYIIFLRESESGVFFGTGSQAGVMLVATKRGGRVK